MTDFTDRAFSVICDITNDDGDLRSVEYGKRQIAEALRAADRAGYLRGVAECELKRAAKKPKSEVVSVPWDGEGVARNTEEMVRADKKKPKRKP